MMHHISHGGPLHIVHEFDNFGKLVRFFAEEFKVMTVRIWMSSDFGQGPTDITAHNGAEKETIVEISNWKIFTMQIFNVTNPSAITR